MSNKWVVPPRPKAPQDASTVDPLYTVMRGGQLAAYLYACAPPGSVSRASAKEQAKLADLPYGAELRCYAKAHEAALLSLAAAAEDIDALLFKLGLEGFDVLPGQHSASAAKRRF